MNSNKNKRGISLIVLVITIIVMIILAAAIILSISSGDIRGKANEAVYSNDKSTEKEVVAVARTEWEINYDELSKEYNDFTEYANEKLEKAQMYNKVVSDVGAVNTIYTDKNGHTALIPDGFSVSTIESEQTIDYGLVIVDKKGNEFVWVPVDDITKFERTTAYTGTTITDPGTNFSEPYKISGDTTGEDAEHTAMKASVEKNKGFYIARYEAGLPEGKTLETVTASDKPMSKKGATVWNKIRWGVSMTQVGTEGAVYYARQMYKNSKAVVSTLCYGVQWDAALRFITNRGIKDTTYTSNSAGKGNYSDSIISETGLKDEYSLNNIYDMAGNVGEWTMECHHYETYRCFRGGNYDATGEVSPASRRQAALPKDTNPPRETLGFRVALYIK